MATTILSSAAGYGVVLGLGLGFAALMICIQGSASLYEDLLLIRYAPHSQAMNSEEFTSGSRSLNPGIIASGIVSAATWAATLLQASTVTYLYGLSGGYWYGSGSTTMIMLFTQNAIMLKRNCPGVHTFLEPVRVRYGKYAHWLFTFYGLGTNILLTGQLITGGSSSIVALTGMSIYAACILIPLTVFIYTFVGGLRATFISDYMHTALIFATILAFMFSAFATNANIGSPSRMWELLQEAAVSQPLAGNAQSSYTTFRSTDGLVFGIIVIISGITTVFCDQSYWQRAVASSSRTTVKGYLLGGFAFAPVPWAFSTAVALAMAALTSVAGSDITALTPAEFGLVAVYGASALLGKAGAVLLLITLFLAVNSAASAELVAVSTIVVYDIYKPYFNPGATEKQVFWASHIAMAGYAVFMAVIGIVFYEAGISLGWLYGLTGVMFSCAVAPVGFAIRVRKANTVGCVLGSILGFACAIAAWLVTAKQYYGILDVTSTGGSYPQLAGNAAGIFISMACCTITRLIWPGEFDFEVLRRMNFAAVDFQEQVEVETAVAEWPSKTVEAGNEKASELIVVPDATEDHIPINNRTDASPLEMYADFKFSVIATIGVFILMSVIIPAFAAIPKTFSSAGFTAWVVVCFIYTAAACAIVIVWPVYEARGTLAKVIQGIRRDLGGRSRL